MTYLLRQVRSSEYAKYLLRGRAEYIAGSRTTMAQIQAIYTRTAREIASEVTKLTPGTLRHAHQAALAKTLERAAKQMNQQIYEGTYKGIYQATAAATGAAQRTTYSIGKKYWGQADIKWAFAEINERAVLALTSRTFTDGLKLSDRIWRATSMARDNLQIMVEDAVARGLDSRKLARDIRRYMQPGAWIDHKAETARRLGVKKDVTYPAMRLARTEINNAYHEGCILGNRSTPGYQGSYWRLSGQHPVPDICDDFATFTGHGGSEPGFYRTGSEPFRPHPQCMCYLVPALEDPEVMAERLKKWVDDPSSDPGLETWYNGVKDYLPRPAGGIALGAAAQAVRAVTGGAKEPGKFVSMTEAQEWAEQSYPHIKWDFLGAHVDTINPTLQEFDRLAKLYPGTAQRLNYVGTHWGQHSPNFKGMTVYKWDNAIAHAATNGQYIGLNPKYYGDPAYFKQALERGLTSGHWPAGIPLDKGIQSIMTHEFGHHVDNYMRHTAFKDQAVMNAYYNYTRDIKRKTRVSQYAKKNQAENWAETFTALNLAQGVQKPIVGIMEKFLQAMRGLGYH